MWLSGLSASLQTKGLLVWPPVGSQAWVADQVPSSGRGRGNWSMYVSHIDVSAPLFLPHFLSLKMNKYNLFTKPNKILGDMPWHLFFREKDKAQFGWLYSSGLNGCRVLHGILKNVQILTWTFKSAHGFVPVGLLTVFSTGFSHRTTSLKMSCSIYTYLNLDLCGCDHCI